MTSTGKSTSKNTSIGITPIHKAQPAPDGKSAAELNASHGRKPGAPVTGGPRQAAYHALLSKTQRVPAALGKRGSK
jgi:hypothetical protein